MDALRDFPEVKNIVTQKGKAWVQKTDIFKGVLWYSYKDDPSVWHSLTAEQVLHILELNRQKKKAASLEEFAAANYSSEEVAFENPVGQDSLTRFDRPKGKKRRKKRNNKRGNNQKKMTRNA